MARAHDTIAWRFRVKYPYGFLYALRDFYPAIFLPVYAYLFQQATKWPSPRSVSAGTLPCTLISCVPAAGAERAAGRHVQRTRHVAFKDDALARSCDIRVRNRNGRQKRLRIRVLRVLVQLVGVRDLDDLAEVHDGDALGNVPHDKKVMRDEQIRNAELSCSSQTC